MSAIVFGVLIVPPFAVLWVTLWAQEFQVWCITLLTSSRAGDGP